MKRIITSYIFLFLTQIMLGQYKGINRQTITENKVPQIVQNAQRTHFSNAFVTGWNVHLKNDFFKDDKTYYIASFKKQGNLGNTAYFTIKGELIGYTYFIQSFDLPEKIQEYCQYYYPNNLIKSGALIDIENPKQFVYLVRLNQQGLLTYLYFNNDGEILDKYTLPKDVFLFI